MVERKIAVKHPWFFFFQMKNFGIVWGKIKINKSEQFLKDCPSIFFLTAEFKQGWVIDLLQVDARLCIVGI